MHAQEKTGSKGASDGDHGHLAPLEGAVHMLAAGAVRVEDGAISAVLNVGVRIARLLGALALEVRGIAGHGGGGREDYGDEAGEKEEEEGEAGGWKTTESGKRRGR